MLNKLSTFTFNHVDQTDDLTTLGSGNVKTGFDSRGKELQTTINAMIDTLNSTVAGSSGTENIGSAPISGVTGATAYAQLVNLKSIIDGMVIAQLPGGYVRASEQLNAGYVVSGGTAVKDDTNLSQLNYAYATAYLKQIDGSYLVKTTTPANFFTSYYNSTYYLDLNPDGTYSWGIVHSSQVNYLPILEVTTNGTGQILAITDKAQRYPKKSYVHVGRNMLAVIDGNTWVPMGWNVIISDLMGEFDGTSSFVSSFNGILRVNTLIKLAAQVACELAVYLNGAMYKTIGGNNNGDKVFGSLDVPVKVNDNVKIYIYCSPAVNTKGTADVVYAQFIRVA